MPATRLPETDLKRVERYCAEKSPTHLADQVRIECRVRGKSVTILESQQMDASGWLSVTVCQLRFRPDSADWALHYADSSSRWHPYAPSGTHVTGLMTRLLAEVEDDPTCIFWG